ncbi:hypothetical protein FHX81_0458 [Saccharothrix saharensis]|uniref:Uncharacterized protein n=1 Tax=Saccharothrix saharensis TaxID=571190 RepID=A0A543J5Y9_9PSEU|nr:hypothetical protein [Saccharothrix saharensis]TQM78202.1 hypothetical protein FHX81_0458 [Saccharothrix saharensis]
MALLDVSEPYLSRRVVQAADFESMAHADGHWYAPVVDVCSSSHDVAAAAARSLSLAGLGAPPVLAPGVSAHAAARLERAWWPAKIIDSELPCLSFGTKCLGGQPVEEIGRCRQGCSRRA